MNIEKSLRLSQYQGLKLVGDLVEIKENLIGQVLKGKWLEE